MSIFQEFIEILVAFGGGRGGAPEPVVVRFLLPLLFWLLLAYAAFREWQRAHYGKDLVIGIAALVGAARELLMLVAEYGGLRGWVDFDGMYYFYPPAEQAATMLSGVCIASAFIYQEAGWHRVARGYLVVALIAITLIYAVTAVAWPVFLHAHPAIRFGQFWGDLLFRGAAVVLLGFALCALVNLRGGNARSPSVALAGFVFLFLDELLMILNILTDERQVLVFAPIRHNLHIWAIPFFVGGYWLDLGRTLRSTLAKAQKDLIEHKLTEDHLELSLSLLRATLESTADGILVVDTNGRIASFNKQFAVLWNLSEAIMAGGDDECLLREVLGQLKEPEVFLAKVRDLYAHPEATSFDVLEFKDGKCFERYSQAQQVGGKTVGRVWSFQDVTARKQAVAKVGQLNAELEQRVRDRSADLEVANQELEAFTYSVSHDLRAPLRHLTGFSELLQKNDRANLDDKARRHLTFISEAAVRMGKLIDDLLAFSKAGRTALRKGPVNLDALVREVITGLHPDTLGRRVIWQIDPLPCVSADAVLLHAVLTNLFSNALKFTRPRAEAQIQMGCTENEREYIFSISDNGVGFDMQYVDKLFGVFQRLHATEQFAGTGIGLANARRIIQRHGGRIRGASVLNAGATFNFSLPKKPIGTNNTEGQTT